MTPPPNAIPVVVNACGKTVLVGEYEAAKALLDYLFGQIPDALFVAVQMAYGPEFEAAARTIIMACTGAQPG
jgi:hypothetical protein